jgi:LytS/YehU family sensor histidine kinase
MEIDCQIEDAARGVAVPGIVLQPLVENAIKHGRQTSVFR